MQPWLLLCSEWFLYFHYFAAITNADSLVPVELLLASMQIPVIFTSQSISLEREGKKKIKMCLFSFFFFFWQADATFQLLFFGN